MLVETRAISLLVVLFIAVSAVSGQHLYIVTDGSYQNVTVMAGGAVYYQINIPANALTPTITFNVQSTYAGGLALYLGTVKNPDAAHNLASSTAPAGYGNRYYVLTYQATAGQTYYVGLQNNAAYNIPVMSYVNVAGIPCAATASLTGWYGGATVDDIAPNTNCIWNIVPTGFSNGYISITVNITQIPAGAELQFTEGGTVVQTFTTSGPLVQTFFLPQTLQLSLTATTTGSQLGFSFYYHVLGGNHLFNYEFGGTGGNDCVPGLITYYQIEIQYPVTAAGFEAYTVDTDVNTASIYVRKEFPPNIWLNQYDYANYSSSSDVVMIAEGFIGAGMYYMAVQCGPTQTDNLNTAAGEILLASSGQVTVLSAQVVFVQIDVEPPSVGITFSVNVPTVQVAVEFGELPSYRTRSTPGSVSSPSPVAYGIWFAQASFPTAGTYVYNTTFLTVPVVTGIPWLGGLMGALVFVSIVGAVVSLYPRLCEITSKLRWE